MVDGVLVAYPARDLTGLSLWRGWKGVQVQRAVGANAIGRGRLGPLSVIGRVPEGGKDGGNGSNRVTMKKVLGRIKSGTAFFGDDDGSMTNF